MLAGGATGKIVAGYLGVLGSGIWISRGILHIFAKSDLFCPSRRFATPVPIRRALETHEDFFSSGDVCPWMNTL